jgi:hypothetical protein
MLLLPSIGAKPPSTNHPKSPIQAFDFYSVRFSYTGHNKFATRSGHDKIQQFHPIVKLKGNEIEESGIIASFLDESR